jgi:hypothetical protein
MRDRLERRYNEVVLVGFPAPPPGATSGSLRDATVTREGVQAGTGAPEAQPGAASRTRVQRGWCWRVPIALRVPPQTHLSGLQGA